MKTLFDKTIQLMQKALELRSKKNAILASNIANVDTPGYREKDLDFRQLMEGYAKKLESGKRNVQEITGQAAPFIPLDGKDVGELPLVATEPGHFSEGSSSAHDVIEISRERGVPNNVDLDEQMSKLSENSLHYQATTQLLAKKFALLRDAATEGGRQ